ncbi:hypothetical protein BH24CHL1_BH24CHL1_01770 [soil metagenome]
MTSSDWMLVLLRVAHSVAAVVWLGGGVYFFLALRPALQEADSAGQAVAAAAQRAYGEWAQIATIVLLGSGVVLTFERLSDNTGGLTYVALLAAKVLAGVWAFALVRVRLRSRRRRNQRSSSELILMLGFVAFTLGIVLATLYGRGFIAQ